MGKKKLLWCTFFFTDHSRKTLFKVFNIFSCFQAFPRVRIIQHWGFCHYPAVHPEIPVNPCRHAAVPLLPDNLIKHRVACCWASGITSANSACLSPAEPHDTTPNALYFSNRAASLSSVDTLDRNTLYYWLELLTLYIPFFNANRLIRVTKLFKSVLREREK